MKDLGSNTEETGEKYISDILDSPDINRAVFLEGLIQLEWMVDIILTGYFYDFGSEKGAALQRCILDDLPFNKKIRILKEEKIISIDIFNDLMKIAEYRNLAAHGNAIPYAGSDSQGWIGKKFIYRIDSEFIQKYKKLVVKCYVYLSSKQREIFHD